MSHSSGSNHVCCGEIRSLLRDAVGDSRLGQAILKDAMKRVSLTASVKWGTYARAADVVALVAWAKRIYHEESNKIIAEINEASEEILERRER